jgi:hypothetical protein
VNFLLPAALLVALLIGAPLAAHFLRRGRATELEFPATSLVPEARSTAKQRARLEDRALLALRSLLILALALLGASPLLRCSRLSVARPGGASLALSLVIDDSLSMRAKLPDGRERFARAIEGARELVSQAREGDAISIVLAGKPARLALAASTDLDAVRSTLDALAAADRSTDVGAALAIARSTLDSLPHVEKRLVLLSDLADAVPLDEKTLQNVLVPLPELREPWTDCGIVAARVRSGGVEAEVVCNDVPSKAGAQEAKNHAERRIELRVPKGSAPLGEGPPREDDAVLATASLGSGESSGTVRLEAPRLYRDMSVHLASGAPDAIAQDDEAPVIPPGTDLVLGALADPATASVQTGGATILETALRALESGARVEPLSVLPEDVVGLERFGALFIDDPAGFTPEVRGALSTWLEQGGVALVFLGPALESAPLGSSFEPFLNGAPRWQPSTGGVDAKSAAWLGEAATSLADLAPKGRARFDNAGDSHVLARWSDGDPWLVERRVGRGLALCAGLPISVTASDLALRPGFLAVLDGVVQEARTRRGGRERLVGEAWDVSADAEVLGPAGKLTVQRDPEREQSYVEPTLRGRYRLVGGKATEERFAVLDPEEILREPRPSPEATRDATARAAVSQVDVSRELAFVVLLLGAIELGARALRRTRARATA